MTKTNPGRFFEDYRVGDVIRHAIPRTVAEGERALYHALYPAQHALYSSDEFAAARDSGVVDLIGIGPVFDTSTKADAPDGIGPDRLRELVAEAGIPAVAIGGINAGNLDEVIAAGARRVVVARAITTVVIVDGTSLRPTRLSDAGRARWVPLGLEPSAGIHRQRAADAGHFGL